MSDGQGGLPSYKDLENAVLDGTAAIHCLTHERDHLRGRVELQERELVSLRAMNEDLWRQLVAIGESYMKFAASCVNQLRPSATSCKMSKIAITRCRTAARPLCKSAQASQRSLQPSLAPQAIVATSRARLIGA